MATPGGREWWNSRREWFSPAFQQEVDGWAPDGAAHFLGRYEQAE
jgi:hypothetical protein